MTPPSVQTQLTIANICVQKQFFGGKAFWMSYFSIPDNIVPSFIQCFYAPVLLSFLSQNPIAQNLRNMGDDTAHTVLFEHKKVLY